MCCAWLLLLLLVVQGAAALKQPGGFLSPAWPTAGGSEAAAWDMHSARMLRGNELTPGIVLRWETAVCAILGLLAGGAMFGSCRYLGLLEKLSNLRSRLGVPQYREFNLAAMDRENGDAGDAVQDEGDSWFRGGADCEKIVELQQKLQFLEQDWQAVHVQLDTAHTELLDVRALLLRSEIEQVRLQERVAELEACAAALEDAGRALPAEEDANRAAALSVQAVRRELEQCKKEKVAAAAAGANAVKQARRWKALYAAATKPDLENCVLDGLGWEVLNARDDGASTRTPSLESSDFGNAALRVGEPAGLVAGISGSSCAEATGLAGCVDLSMATEHELVPAQAAEEELRDDETITEVALPGDGPLILGAKRAQGSEGIVWNASLGTVAFVVKTALEDEGLLQEEARLLRLFAGPGVVQSFGLHDVQGPCSSKGLVLECCACDYLAAVLQPPPDLRQLPTPKAVLIAVLGALERLHNCGVVHRDVKPKNIFIRTTGDVVLGDFGAACEVTDEEAMEDRIVHLGSCAPEVFVEGPLDTSIDIFSSGCVFFFGLAGGALPFPGRSAAEVEESNSAGNITWEPVAHIAEQDLLLLKRLMALQPGERPSACDALAQLALCDGC